MEEITFYTKIKRKEDMLQSYLDNELIMMSPEKGKYFTMNEVATRIWQLLEAEQTLIEIVNTLITEFEVDEETCKVETASFINSLIKKDIIEIV